jgi:hypothetical protein
VSSGQQQIKLFARPRIPLNLLTERPDRYVGAFCVLRPRHRAGALRKTEDRAQLATHLDPAAFIEGQSLIPSLRYSGR